MSTECDAVAEINYSLVFVRARLLDPDSILLFTYIFFMSQARTKSARICRTIERIRLAIGVLTMFTAALMVTTRITWGSLIYRSIIRNHSLNHCLLTKTTNSTASFIIMAVHSDMAIIICRPIRIRFTAEPEEPRNAPSEPVRDSGSAEESFGRRI